MQSPVLVPLPKIRADLRGQAYGRFMREQAHPEETTVTEEFTTQLAPEEPTVIDWARRFEDF